MVGRQWSRTRTRARREREREREKERRTGEEDEDEGRVLPCLGGSEELQGEGRRRRGERRRRRRRRRTCPRGLPNDAEGAPSASAACPRPSLSAVCGRRPLEHRPLSACLALVLARSPWTLARSPWSHVPWSEPAWNGAAAAAGGAAARDCKRHTDSAARTAEVHHRDDGGGGSSGGGDGAGERRDERDGAAEVRGLLCRARAHPRPERRAGAARRQQPLVHQRRCV